MHLWYGSTHPDRNREPAYVTVQTMWGMGARGSFVPATPLSRRLWDLRTGGFASPSRDGFANLRRRAVNRYLWV